MLCSRIQYLPERQELRVDLQCRNSDDVVQEEKKTRGSHASSSFQPSLRQSSFSSAASILRVVGFDVRLARPPFPRTEATQTASRDV